MVPNLGYCRCAESECEITTQVNDNVVNIISICFNSHIGLLLNI